MDAKMRDIPWDELTPEQQRECRDRQGGRVNETTYDSWTSPFTIVSMPPGVSYDHLFAGKNTVATFEKRFDDGAVEELKKNDLFKNHLLKDCQDGKVFPAIRNGRIDFYYKGGKLFSFENGEFRTHYKYASVMHGKPADYISEKGLKGHSLIEDFSDGYERIKENCASYSGVEADGVSKLYHKFSCVAPKGDVVILDIEIAFATPGKKGNDPDEPVRVVDQKPDKDSRIDFLCFNTKTGELRFFEAKHYTNPEIKSKNGEPALLDQLRRYDENLGKQEGQILEAYKKHVEAINEIFETKLPVPSELDLETKALIFGFDSPQRGNLAGKILDKEDLRKRTYAIGDISGAEISKLFEGVCGFHPKGWQ